MIVSWKWLEQYVDLKMSHDDLVDRLTMSGLNHEGTEDSYGDQAIDLEVTSNRPDCLGHLGVAREIGVLYGTEFKVPSPNPSTSSNSINDHCSVKIECPELCYRYTARLLKNVKIGPSPDWLADRLRTLGIAVINNVVDATNYVMFECGQPLHAFDFAKVEGGQIIVREPKKDEKIIAIDHKTYTLPNGACVIADANSPVAIGGVMGGAESEVSDTTTDILIEAAYFNPLSVRNTARSLNLFSPSSFRFERNIDSEMIDWASKRCCEIIMESGGGELLEGMIDAGQQPEAREPITLRHSQLQRVLGIEIPSDFIEKTLRELGLEIKESNAEKTTCVAPSWRKDLTREIDLVEEVGRIYGFDKVPDDAAVPMAASHKTTSDRVLDKVRTILLANGFDEAMTPSLVPEPWSNAFSPWSELSPLISSQPMLGVLEKASQNIGAVDLLRRSIVPSLLEARRINEYRSNSDIELFETSKVYLTRSDSELPDQPEKVAVVSGQDFFAVKQVLQTLASHLNPTISLQAVECDFELLDVDESAQLMIGETVVGFVGKVSKSGEKLFGLRGHAAVAELDLGVLKEHSVIIPQHQNQSLFPAMTRDFNFILENKVHWADLKNTVYDAGGELLESVNYRETFRDEKKDGAGMKRLLMTVVLRSTEATLTSEQADAACQRIIESCKSKLNASLVA